ncbi:hypothetical protein COCVIDRAFT_103111 [Bipolaris victoriae FI3]|uniref:Uncharacterized protein n=1 Tax=Bipolaris victoriae (strain FI3) TaxID=930091 RepID=W7E565_BIPV3|nr:hypothetical protein COCVIDRAFT_103111 [Bipolaris victoriae FI3]
MVDSSSPRATHVTNHVRYPRLPLRIPRCLTPPPKPPHPYALLFALVGVHFPCLRNPLISISAPESRSRLCAFWRIPSVMPTRRAVSSAWAVLISHFVVEGRCSLCFVLLCF